MRSVSSTPSHRQHTRSAPRPCSTWRYPSWKGSSQTMATRRSWSMDLSGKHWSGDLVTAKGRLKSRLLHRWPSASHGLGAQAQTWVNQTGNHERLWLLFGQKTERLVAVKAQLKETAIINLHWASNVNPFRTQHTWIRVNPVFAFCADSALFYTADGPVHYQMVGLGRRINNKNYALHIWKCWAFPASKACRCSCERTLLFATIHT